MNKEQLKKHCSLVTEAANEARRVGDRMYEFKAARASR